MQPKQILDTVIPVLPSLAYCIVSASLIPRRKAGGGCAIVNADEKNRSHHTAAQAGRREGGAEGHRHRRHDGHGSARARPAKGAQGGLPRNGVPGGPAAEDEAGDRYSQRAFDRSDSGPGGFSQDRKDRGRKNIRLRRGGGDPDPERRPGRKRAISRPPTWEAFPGGRGRRLRGEASADRGGGPARYYPWPIAATP